jgi:hypothetical protein
MPFFSFKSLNFWLFPLIWKKKSIKILENWTKNAHFFAKIWKIQFLPVKSEKILNP